VLIDSSSAVIEHSGGFLASLLPTFVHIISPSDPLAHPLSVIFEPSKALPSTRSLLTLLLSSRMSLTRQSLAEPRSVSTLNGSGIGDHQDKPPRQHTKLMEINPPIGTFSNGEAGSRPAQTGTFPFCACRQLISATSMTAECACREAPLGITHNQRGRGEGGRSVDEREAKWLEISNSTGDQLAVAYGKDGFICDVQSRHHKASRCTNCNTKIAFDTDGESLVRAEEDLINSMDEYHELADDITSLGAEIPSDRDKERFLSDDLDTTGSNETESTFADDDASMLSLETPPATQPVTPSSWGTQRSTYTTDTLWDAHAVQHRVRGRSITSVGILESMPNRLHLSPGLLARNPKLKASQRRKRGKAVVYEDETATPSGWSEARYSAGGWLHTVNHRTMNRQVLTVVDRGQENRQPVYHVPQARRQAATILDEEDEDEAQAVATPRTVVSDDSWPATDGISE
jgi:hypothetical protein